MKKYIIAALAASTMLAGAAHANPSTATISSTQGDITTYATIGSNDIGNMIVANTWTSDAGNLNDNGNPYNSAVTQTFYLSLSLVNEWLASGKKAALKEAATALGIDVSAATDSAAILDAITAAVTANQTAAATAAAEAATAEAAADLAAANALAAHYWSLITQVGDTITNANVWGDSNWALAETFEVTLDNPAAVGSRYNKVTDKAAPTSMGGQINHSFSDYFYEQNPNWSQAEADGLYTKTYIFSGNTLGSLDIDIRVGTEVVHSVDVTIAGYSVWNQAKILSNAFEETFEAGYEEGYADGFADGYDEGYNDGFGDGYNKGYATGYTNGVADTKKSVLAAAGELLG